MLFTVEVRLIGGDFVTALTQMRTWLDHRRIEPDAFRHSAGGAGVTFRVEFKVESEAAQFARTFGGRLIGMATPHPGTVALWPSGDQPRPLALSGIADAAPDTPRKRSA